MQAPVWLWKLVFPRYLQPTIVSIIVCVPAAVILSAGV